MVRHTSRRALRWKGECFLASGGFLFPGRIIQLPGGQLYATEGRGEQIGIGAAAAAAAAARDGRGPKRTGQRARKRVIPRQRVCQSRCFSTSTVY